MCAVLRLVGVESQVLQDAKDIENKVLLAERILLHTLCFDLQITHPYKFCIEKVKSLRSEFVLVDCNCECAWEMV